MNSGLRIVDVDSHVTEPPDLWTSRVPKRWVELVPHVVWDERRGEERWQIGDRRFYGVAGTAMAGWGEFPPSHPKTLEQADPGSWDPVARLERLTEYGIDSQVLYPNLIGFFMTEFLKLKEPEIVLGCVRAYNDFIAEFAATDNARFIPLMVLPFWDIEASLREIDRCVELGHRGIVFASRFQTIDLPPITDRHWDPIWSAASERGLSINFHVGFGPGDVDSDAGKAMASHGVKQDYVITSLMMVSGNMRTIAEVIVGGVCHRFPTLKLVSVESGVGWLPFLVEALDWHWLNTGAHREFPDMEMPSTYFHRQIYGTMWFERESIKRNIDLFADNIMYSTDYPHPTSMSPGPASYASVPRDFVAENLGDLPEPILRKLLSENAAAVYNLDPVSSRRA